MLQQLFMLFGTVPETVTVLLLNNSLLERGCLASVIR